MSISNFFILATCILLSSNYFAVAQVEPDSLIQEEAEPAEVEPNVVWEDTVGILEYPEKPYVTADEVDTVVIEDTSEEFSPRLASLYSAILPGLGQAYNEKYWKIPLIYGGLISLGLVVDFYADSYDFYRRSLLTQRATGTNPTGRDERVLELATNSARRERDFFIIMCGLAYLINIVDAHIDAHLKGFDVSDDLTLKLEPSLNSTAFNTPIGGIGLTLYIK